VTDEKSIHVTSYNQQGGITAFNVNIQQGDRRLTETSINKLEQLISDQQFKSIDVVAVMGDGEAFRFATQIMNYLDGKSYNVDGAVDQAMYTNPPQGVVIKPAGEGGILQIIVGSR